MPFPIAHPAAALPLRRWCSPRGLNFSALVIGTLIPDFGYCLGQRAAILFHSFWPGIAVCLAAGWAVFLLFQFLRLKLSNARGGQWKWLLPQPGPTRMHLIPLSLGIGAFSHIVLDSLTHRNGWIVKHVALLQSPILHIGTRQERVCDALYYALTFAGGAWLTFCLATWKERFSAKKTKTAWKYAISITFAAALVAVTAVVRGRI